MPRSPSSVTSSARAAGLDAGLLICQRPPGLAAARNGGVLCSSKRADENGTLLTSCSQAAPVGERRAVRPPSGAAADQLWSASTQRCRRQCRQQHLPHCHLFWFLLFLHGLTSGLWSVTEPSPDAPGPRGQGMSICYNRALAAELVSSSLNLAASRLNTAGRYLSIGLHATLTATPIVADFCCGCLLQACSPQPATLPVGLPPAAGSARQHTGLRTNASATPSDAQPASAAAPVMHNRFQNQS